MPEILTKHPELVLKILKEAGINCAVGSKQQILTTCPPQNFCSLATGELCIYGLNNISSMTQIAHKDLVKSSLLDTPCIISVVVFFVAGVLVGWLLQRTISKGEHLRKR